MDECRNVFKDKVKSSCLRLKHLRWTLVEINPRLMFGHITPPVMPRLIIGTNFCRRHENSYQQLVWKCFDSLHKTTDSLSITCFFSIFPLYKSCFQISIWQIQRSFKLCGDQVIIFRFYRDGHFENVALFPIRLAEMDFYEGNNILKLTSVLMLCLFFQRTIK